MTESMANNKLKRMKSPPHSLDQQYLKTITSLNDTVISEAIRDHDNSTAQSFLTQLEQSIKVNHLIGRMATMEHILQARSNITTISMSATTIKHSFIRIMEITIKLKSTLKRRSRVMKKYRGSSSIESKI